MKLKQCARKPTKDKMINIKVTPDELKALQANADRYTEGNLSLWLRYAGTKLNPPQADLI